MPFLQSAAIETVVYDESTHALRAKFRADGKVMVYENVPQDVYDSLIFADSVSGFFQEHIQGTYPVREASREVGEKKR
jgi:hypothetical protein